MKKLRTFEGIDYFNFQGAATLPDGRKPMIAEGKNATLLLCGFESKDFGIEILFDESTGMYEAFRGYTDIARAEVDAELLAQLLDCDLTDDFLLDLGFEIVY